MTARSPSFSSHNAPTPSDDFGALLGPLMQEVPLLFEMEILSRLNVSDLFALAGVSREREEVRDVQPRQDLHLE